MSSGPGKERLPQAPLHPPGFRGQGVAHAADPLVCLGGRRALARPDDEEGGDSLMLLEPAFKTLADARSHMKSHLDDGKYVIIRLVERCEMKSELVRKAVLVTLSP